MQIEIIRNANSVFCMQKCGLQVGSGVFEAVLLDFSALNVAQSNGRLPFHALDVHEYEGVCCVLIERKGDCVCGNVVRGGEKGQMERDYAVATVDILQGVVVNARSVEVFSVEMEGGTG